MTSPAVFSTAPAIKSLSTTHNRLISPMPLAPPSDRSPTLRKNANNNRSILLHRIKSLASDSMAKIESPEKIGSRVRVKVPLTVYHIPKVPEVDLKGKEGKIKENVAVWKGKNISANFPYKIEFLEKLEGRGDAPVKFIAHLKEDEFEYID